MQNRNFSGPNGELGAAVCYFSQCYTMSTGRGKGALTFIGTEEIANWEMIANMIFKLTQGATIAQIEEADYDGRTPSGQWWHLR